MQRVTRDIFWDTLLLVEHIKCINVVINDEVCLEAHSENTTSVQDKPIEVDDSLPIDYVGET